MEAFLASPWAGILVVAAAFAASAVGTRWLATVLERRRIVDRPNERSSHTRPTPRGGGLAVVTVFAAAWAMLAALGLATEPPWPLAVGTIVLVVVSWLDDLRDLPAGLRFAMQGIAVGLGLLGLPEGAVFQGLLPPLLDYAFAFLAWLWFVNLFNFMDGIDGLAGVETVAVALGVAGVAWLGLPETEAWLPLALAAAAAGFLLSNWHPARIFMGDVGSVPIGFVAGWLLLGLAAEGSWAAALILPLYYLADATLTLTRRALRGERVWRAHREHFYQRAVQAGLDHAAVARRVAAVNVLLVGMAFAITVWPGLTWAGLGVATTAVAALLAHLSQPLRGVRGQ